MSRTFPKKKTRQETVKRGKQVPLAGPNGISIAPHAYGIRSLDRALPGAALKSNSGLTIQAKFNVTAAGDPTEKEADQIAEKVIAQIDRPEVAPFRFDGSKQSDSARISPKPLAPVGFAGEEAPPEVAASIKQAKGGSSGLDRSVRSQMNRAFGTDFSDVRIHTDRVADSLNRDLHANAFTTGQDIFFRQGQYDPKSRTGQKLIAHELTHVVQQGAEGAKTVSRTSPQAAVQRNIRLQQEKKSTGKSKKKKVTKAYTVEQVMEKLARGYKITEENFPGLTDELQSLSDSDATFQSTDLRYDFNQLVKYLRARLWIPPREPDAAASLDEDDHPEQLLTGMLDLQQSGLKYTKPRSSFTTQTDFWQIPEVAPYIMNCWQTVLLAAYRQGLISHRTFVLADKAVTIDAGSSNVMSEAIYQTCGDNKIEWKRSDPDEVENALRALTAARIPAGWVIVVGREGQHVGVSTGNTRAAQDEDTLDKMGMMAEYGHEWIENNTRSGRGLPVSDLRVSTLEDSITHFDGAGGVYWAPLPREFSTYIKAKEFLDSLKALDKIEKEMGLD